MKLPTLLFLLVLIAGIGGITLEQRARSRLRYENGDLQSHAQAVAKIQGELASLGGLRETNQEVVRLREEIRDLHRVRNEIRQLKGQTEVLDALKKENDVLKSAVSASATSAVANSNTPGASLTIEQLSPRGTLSPEATLQTFLWAMRQGDYERLRGCLTPEALSKVDEREVAEQVERSSAEMKEQLGSMRIVARQQVSSDEVRLGVEIMNKAGEKQESTALPFKLLGGEWRLDLPFP